MTQVDFIAHAGGLSYRLLTYANGEVRFEHRCDRGARGVRICAPLLRVGDALGNEHWLTRNEAGQPTVRPSILCRDCGTHGFITDGRWVAWTVPREREKKMAEYPTDEELERIREWPIDDPGGWFAFVRSVWWMPDWGWREASVADEYQPEVTVTQYRISTGGWSGNESILTAMQQNWLWHMTWVQSRRGGHYIFEQPLKPVEVPND